MLLVGLVLAALAIALIAVNVGSATQSPIEMKFACALKSNGLMRYVSNLNQCKSTEIQVTIHPGPTSLCINPDGSVRKIPPFQCKKPGVVITIPPASGTVYFCASNTTGVLRFVSNPSQCTATEFPVFVGPNAGTIVVKKVTNPSPDPSDTSFSFTAGGGLAPTSFSLKNGQQQTFSNVTPRNGYSVSETVPSGWDLTSSTCSDGSPVSNIDVSPGETVTCTFTDRKKGSIIVRKVTNPSPDPSDTSFSFSAGGGLSPTSFSLKNGDQQTFSNLTPGNGYSVAESVPSGWALTSSACDDGSPVSNVDVSPGETVTCTFTDRKKGSIIIKKVTDPSPDPSDTSFSFSAGGGLSPSSFSLRNGDQQTFSDLTPGSGYNVSETVPSGWALTSSTCDDGSPVTNIDVGAGETVTCTFTDQKQGTIVIKKVTDPSPDPSDTSFSFSAGGGLSPSSFSLKNGDQQTFSNLTPGSGYNVTESVPLGWELTSSTCDDGSPVTNIDVSAGENVTCTFTDTKQATIIVKKVTDPDPDPSDTSFLFTAGGGLSPSSFSLKNGDQQTFSNLTPGSGYNVSETVPAGWDLTSSICDDGSPVSNIDVSAGETVTCTFTDTQQRGSIVVKKVTNPSPDASDTSFAFTTGGGLIPSGFTLKNGDQQTFSDVAAGSGYSVAETVPAGWALTSATCDDGSPVTNIDVSDNETVTCTFTDRKQGTIIVKKVTDPSPDPSDTSFPFTAGGGLSPSSFSLKNGDQQTFSNIDPGSGYTVSETVPGGWNLISSTCDDGSPVSNIDVGAGETVTCTFTDATNRPPTDIQLSNSSIAENQPSGTDVGTLTTTDPDVGDTHTYTLENTGCGGGPFPDNGSFQIGGVNSDKVQSAASFDFETKSSYTICVRTTDGGGLSFDKQFTISITDVNEPPTDITLSNNSIDENKPSGSLVGNLSQAGDPDSGETYSFTVEASGCSGSFPDSNSFQISGSQLQSAVSFDFETKNTYTICVRVHDSGLTFDKQFTININDVNDAPVANPDSYSGAIGNTVATLQATATGPHVTLTGNSLLANDTDPDTTFPHTLSAVAETVSTTGGGSVQIHADGSFVYTPGVGDKNQDDTFHYQVTDGSLTTIGTATIHIDNFLVWYVDNSSAAVTHDGRSNSPFLDLSSLNGAGGSGDSDGPGDYIFLYYGTGASYGGGIPLEASQSLWGEKQGLVVNGKSLVPAGTNAPTVTNASGVGVGLAGGADVEGLNISGTSGDAVNGSAVSSATVGTTAPVNISNAGGDGIDLSGAASGNISIAAPIADSAGLNVSVANRSGGTVAFSGAISDSAAGTGGGISLSANTGATVNFTGGLVASTTTNPAFSATGGGTVNLTGANNTLATTTATALNVANTTIGSSGLTFKRIDSSGGSSTGIILDTTGSSGGLTVTGSGTAGSGGTIANKTGSDGSNTTGDGIYLNSTSSPSFARMQLNDFQNFAIRGTSVNGFTLSDSTISGTNGTSAANDEASLAIDNLTGSASITNDNISGGFEDDARIKNTTGSLTSLSITGSTFATANLTTANDALSLIGQTGVTLFNASVTGNTFTRAQGDLYQYTLNTGTGTMHFDSNTVTNNYSATATLPAGGGDINVSSGSLGNNPSLTYTVSNNQIYASGTGGQPPNGSVIVAAATPQGSATGTISGNTIGTTGITQSAGFDAIFADAVGAGFHKVTISNNTIRRYKEAGIRLLGVSGSSFNIRATVTGNTITEPDSVAFAGIDAEVGGDPSDIGTMCLDLGGSGSLANSVSNGDPSNFNDINLIQSFNTSINLPGYAGTAYDDAAVEAFEAPRNNGDGTPTVFAGHDIAGPGYTHVGTDCS